MASIDEFSRVVSEIYASSVSPANWVVALSEISRVLDASGGGLLVGAGNHRSVMAATMPQEAVATYREYYYAIDFVLDACVNSPAGLIRGGSELVALQRHSEFHADWQRPFNLTDGLFVRLSTGQTPTSFVVAAPERSEPFETAERVQFVRALIRHLQQALRTQDHLAELGRAATDITEVIDAIRHGIIIVGPGYRVLHLNFAAEQIFNSGEGLYIRSGSIEATRASTNEQLQGSITRALVEQRCGARGGHSFACSRPSGKRPYVIHVLPLSATSDDPSTAKALVIIIDPEQEPEPPKMLIRRLFGLTNAEADVALRVMRGDGLRPISAALALSRATVNTHLQHVFDKTDTHRQAELVRLLLTIIP
jgi:DNA-binding CsgD family transcriptional regulator/PAS domain-containing protein